MGTLNPVRPLSQTVPHCDNRSSLLRRVKAYSRPDTVLAVDRDARPGLCLKLAGRRGAVLVDGGLADAQLHARAFDTSE